MSSESARHSLGPIAPTVSVYELVVDDHQRWVTSIRRVWGFDGAAAQDLRSSVIYRKAQSTEELEIFRRSHSFRWSTHGQLGFVNRDCVIGLGAAMVQAKRLMRTLGIWKEYDTYTWNATRVMCDGAEAGVVVHRHLTFHYRLSGIRVGGPGYRTKVTFDDAGEIVEVLHLSRSWGPIVVSRAPDHAWAHRMLVQTETPGFAQGASSELVYLVGSAANAQQYCAPFFLFSSMLKGTLLRRAAPAFTPSSSELHCFAELGLNLLL